MAERQIFVADHGRRVMLIRFSARGAAAVAGLWLIALLAGAFGFGRLPAVPLPPLGTIREHSSPSTDGGPARGRPHGAARVVSEARSSGPDAVSAPTRDDDRSRRRIGAAPRRERRPPASAAPSPAPPAQGSGSATPSSAAKTTKPRDHERAPAYTPSGNEVAAGTTAPGTTDLMPSSATGWWRKH
jgi:hypothetical protein